MLLALLACEISKGQIPEAPIPINVYNEGPIIEPSGMIILPNGNLLVINDSGHAFELYELNKQGEIVETHFLSCADSLCLVDPEGLAYDNEGFIYIGDFGNNHNTRTDLKILRFPLENLESDSIRPEKLYYKYPDQYAFPPPEELKNFDCEAMVYFEDHLYLFAKNRGISEYCRIYQLNISTVDIQQAILFDSVKLDKWVTGVSLTENKFYMLSHNFLWHSDQFFPGQMHAAEFTGHLLTNEKFEGIAANEEGVYLISDPEYSAAALFNWIAPSLGKNCTGGYDPLLLPEGKTELNLYNLHGTQVYHKDFQFLHGSTVTLNLPAFLPAQPYILEILGAVPTRCLIYTSGQN